MTKAPESVPCNWGSLILHGVEYSEKEIGRGAYGRVFEVNYEGTLCAAKEVHAILLMYAQGDELEKIKDDFLSECKIWSTLRHPCVVQFLGVHYPAKDQYKLPVMVMEKMQYSLRSLVEKYDNIPLNVKLSILDEVCLGLRYLHSRNPPIVHRDLTPNNILLSYRLEAKITDLGVAKVMKSDNEKTMTKLPGTPDFMPPEALGTKPVYGPSLDVFSYGGVILNVTTQQWPQPTDLVEFNPDTGKRELVSEVKRRQKYLDEMSGEATNLKSLVVDCLNDNPSGRPPVAEVLMRIKRVKDSCSQKKCRDGMSPMEWWAGACGHQKSQTTDGTLEETTIEQLKREIDVLKTDKQKLQTKMNAMMDTIEQLKTINDKQKDKIGELTTLLNKHKVVPESTTLDDLVDGSVTIDWKEVAPIPVGCHGHTAVWLNGLVYVGGGTPTQWNASYTINRYDPTNNSWNTIKTPYCHFAMTTLYSKLFVVGGQDKKNKKTNQILTTDAVQLKNYTKMTIARKWATAAGHQGMLIITGGSGDKYNTLSSTELFDTSNGQWYSCSDLPHPHSELQSVIVNNMLYLLGGYNQEGPSPAVFSASLDTLSKHQLMWNTHQDTPWCNSAPVSVDNNQLLIVGGCKGTCTSNISTDIYKLNKVSNSWEAIGHIPSARSSSAAVTIADNRIIVIGGYDDKEWSTSTVWIGSYHPQ